MNYPELEIGLSHCDAASYTVQVRFRDCGLMKTSGVFDSVLFLGLPLPQGEVGLSGPGEGCRALEELP